MFNGTIGTISNFTETGAQYGILAGNNSTTSIGLLANSTLSDNSDYGLYLTLSGPSVIEGNTIDGNSTGAWLNGPGIVFGDANLADGKGNILSGNTIEALIAQGVMVVGNTISNSTGRYESVDIDNGSSFSYNLVFGNTGGVEINTTTSVIGNRIFDNVGTSGSSSGIGLIISAPNVNVSQNTIYSNGIGIQVFGWSGETIQNNLIYADTYAGIHAPGLCQRYYHQQHRLRAQRRHDDRPGQIPVGSSARLCSVTPARAVRPERHCPTTSSSPSPGVAVQVSNASQAGFVSDYNLFQTGSGGRIGSWLGLTQTTLAQWVTATGRDTHSQFGNPALCRPPAAPAISAISHRRSTATPTISTS